MFANLLFLKPERLKQQSPGQRPGNRGNWIQALQGRDKTVNIRCLALSGLRTSNAKTQGVALGSVVSGFQPYSAALGLLERRVA
jgi:hypothetical protein